MTSANTVSTEKQQSINFFQNLLLVAIADRYLDTAESDFLVQVGDQMGLSEEDVIHLSENPSELEFVIPKTAADRVNQLRALVRMMLQDGEIEKQEYDLCLQYADRVGFDKQVLDDLIQDMDMQQG